jgi:amino-acid N-acetyltransferase
METKRRAAKDLGISIEPADPVALQAVCSLLERSNLPTEGLAEHFATALVAKIGERIVGSAALELHGTSALLRSVAVEEPFRRQGIGRRLTYAALDLAKRTRVGAVYLLTTTAEEFFAELGFRRIPRSEVPEPVQQSVEFASACPVTATVMMISLTDAGREARPSICY